MFAHSNVRLPLDSLRRIVVTPDYHHWHHSADPAHYNRNYASELPLLDMIFGTYHCPPGERPTSYGIGEPVPNGYLRQVAWAFLPYGAGRPPRATPGVPNRSNPPWLRAVGSRSTTRPIDRDVARQNGGEQTIGRARARFVNGL